MAQILRVPESQKDVLVLKILATILFPLPFLNK
jgi:hypothetical protein